MTNIKQKITDIICNANEDAVDKIVMLFPQLQPIKTASNDKMNKSNIQKNVLDKENIKNRILNEAGVSCPTNEQEPVLCNCGNKPELKFIETSTRWWECPVCGDSTEFISDLDINKSIETWNNHQKTSICIPEIGEVWRISDNITVKILLIFYNGIFDEYHVWRIEAKNIISYKREDLIKLISTK